MRETTWTEVKYRKRTQQQNMITLYDDRHTAATVCTYEYGHAPSQRCCVTRTAREDALRAEGARLVHRKCCQAFALPLEELSRAATVQLYEY